MSMLFKYLAELNVTANVARKGRGDLNENAVKIAMDVLSSRAGYKDSSCLVRGVCKNFLESLVAMLIYLHGVLTLATTQCESCIDPELQRNAGLVERLADLEESWEMVGCYVEDAAMRCSLDSMGSQLKATQEFDPIFQQMCSDCDVELFLVIPRLILLAYLKDPTKDALMRRMLPKAFEGTLGSRSDELCSIERKYIALLKEDSELVDFLSFQAIHGVGAEAIEELISKERQQKGTTFMRELEGWSMELQRMRASEWNAFCSVLVQYMSEECKKRPVKYP